MNRKLFHRKYLELRNQAEAILANGQESPQIATTTNLGELQHEVAVQQIELEMQHDELMRTHHELGELLGRTERERDYYQRLFDMAPLGMLVLTSNGVIRACNQAFSRSVAQAASGLAGRTLAEFVASQDRMNFDILLREEIKHLAGRKISFHLTDKKNKSIAVVLMLSALERTADIGTEYLAMLMELPHE